MKRTYDQAREYGQLGIIESVCLRNFMCHDNLTFDFDPHMNFIVGQNGSGKSAILTGIILALGGKSGATGRHTNIKGFIKTGKHSATVSVTLKNCGPEAYRKMEYGERITVERHFNAEGVSSYKIKSQSGQILSTSKEELTNILSIMDIQIENPITVLTQEISRNFLVSKTSKGHKLFQLFYSGTGLSRVEEDYKRSVQQKEETLAEVNLKKAALPEMEKEVKHLKSLIDKTSKVTDLKKELLWAKVIEIERIKDEEEKNVRQLKKEVSALNKAVDTCKKEYGNANQALTQAQLDKNESNKKMDTLRRELNEHTAKRMDLNKEIREIKGTLSSFEREVKRLSSEASNLENMINEIKLKNQNDVHEEKKKRENQINELRGTFEKYSAEIDSLGNNKNILLHKSQELGTKLEACHVEIQELKYSLKNVEREKQQLSEGMSNRINVFGSEMKHLLQDIKTAVKAGLFRVAPKGPIGLFINVKNPEWNFAVQECLKSSFLRNFCCDNHVDADQLTKIINKHYSSSRSKPSIITTKFVNKVFDVRKHKTISKYPTLLDMLNITDPVIANCLIDQRQIENILLIADQKEAINFMMGNPPRDCISAYNLSGDQICQSPYRFYSCRNTNQICMLKTVNQDDIRRKDEELKAANSSMGRKYANKDNLVAENDQIKIKIEKIDRRLAELTMRKKEIQMKISDLENSYEETKDINCLESDLEQIEKDKQNNQEKLLACKKAIDEKIGELNVCENAIEEYKNILNTESHNFQKLSETISECENKKEKYDSTLKKLESKLQTLEPKLRDSEEKLAEYIDTAQKIEDSAAELCPRINTRRSPESIQQMLSEMEKAVQRQRNCDRETLIIQYEEKISRLNKAKRELERLENLCAYLDKMLDHRFDEFQKICKNTVVSLTCCFTTLLKQNNFSGYPEVNLQAKTLDIFAKPDKMNASTGSKQNLAQLSGGERSYITLAFLLSLWDRIHMPFRILDEYDVFMDPNNRHLSINLLVNEARSNKNIQYIFLSPLELPPMAHSSHVKVHKMPAPKR